MKGKGKGKMLKEDMAAWCVQSTQKRNGSKSNARKRKQMKRKKAIIGTLMVAFFIGSCGIVGKNDLESEGIVLAKETETVCEATEPEYRAIGGRYYLNGTVITSDGHEWRYDTTEISGKKPYDNMPVIVVFEKANVIEDDIIKGIVYDDSEETYVTIGGTVLHKHVIICDDEYWRKYKNNVYADGTRVVVKYDGNGTEDPYDDIVKSVEREK